MAREEKIILDLVIIVFYRQRSMRLRHRAKWSFIIRRDKKDPIKLMDVSN